MPLPKPFSISFQKNQSIVYIFFWGLDIRKAPQITIRSYEELWTTYWKLADEKLAEYRRLEGQSLVPSLNDYIGKNQGKETDYQKALVTLFESDDHPEIYPIPITGDTTLLLMALGWKEYEKEYRKAEKEASDEGEDEDNDDSSLDEPIVKPRSAQYAACFVPSLPTKPPAKPKSKTNLKPTPPSKAGKGGKGGKVTKPTKGKSALPRVSLVPFPQRKGFPYALLGDTKALKDYLNEMNSENKIASYVSNVNGQFGPGWNLKAEAAEKIRESDGSEFELVEYETLEEYEKISRPKAD